MQDHAFEIDTALFDNVESIESRVAAVSETDRDALRLILSYLYVSDGPQTIWREHKSQAEGYLDPVERFVFQWLYKRTDGKLKRLYGAPALSAAKLAKLRCETCQYADVRALNLEKAEFDEEANVQRYQCLCANCNTVQARSKEMESIAIDRKRAADAHTNVSVDSDATDAVDDNG